MVHPIHATRNSPAGNHRPAMPWLRWVRMTDTNLIQNARLCQQRLGTQHDASVPSRPEQIGQRTCPRVEHRTSSGIRAEGTLQPEGAAPDFPRPRCVRPAVSPRARHARGPMGHVELDLARLVSVRAEVDGAQVQVAPPHVCSGIILLRPLTEPAGPRERLCFYAEPVRNAAATRLNTSSRGGSMPTRAGARLIWEGCWRGRSSSQGAASRPPELSREPRRGPTGSPAQEIPRKRLSTGTVFPTGAGRRSLDDLTR